MFFFLAWQTLTNYPWTSQMAVKPTQDLLVMGDLIFYCDNDAANGTCFSFPFFFFFFISDGAALPQCDNDNAPPPHHMPTSLIFNATMTCMSSMSSFFCFFFMSNGDTPSHTLPVKVCFPEYSAREYEDSRLWSDAVTHFHLTNSYTCMKTRV
jgi:hypothetical protein